MIILFERGGFIFTILMKNISILLIVTIAWFSILSLFVMKTKPRTCGTAEPNYISQQLDSLITGQTTMCLIQHNGDELKVYLTDEELDYPTFLVLIEDKPSLEYICKGELMLYLSTDQFKYNDYLCY